MPSPETATVFPDSLPARPAAGSTDRAPPVRHVCVVGGGSAGWMTALLLAHSAYGPRLQVTVLESPQVGIIGVGEGSTPWLRGFFDGLGIEEAEWMPACHATWKSGITFEGWSTRPGFERYFHPFPSMLDNLTMGQFVHNVHARLDGADVHAHPDRYFVATTLARAARAPKAPEHFPFDVWYGYHFDAVLLGRFLQGKATARGVRHLERHVVDVERAANGDIATLRLDDGERLAADFFVDCTGFASRLMGQALGVPHVSFADNLFNDAAIALPTPSDGPIESQTVSTALRHGWAWKIPLTNRVGNGYVYSRAACTPDAAETELRVHLGLLDADIPARHLTMRIGRLARHWHRNCVAIGLSQGFIEPLEATALLFVQRTAMALVAALEAGDLGEAAQARFDATVNRQFENTRDYIVAHYKANGRTDTEYWRANAANTSLSGPLRRLLRTWLTGRPIAPGLRAGEFGGGYPIVSWYALLAGLGVFPDDADLRPPTAAEDVHRIEQIDDLVARSAANFPDHRAALGAIPPRRKTPSLQLYQWG